MQMSFKYLSVPNLKVMLDEKPVKLVDIRDSASFGAGNIEGSMQLCDDNLQEFMDGADKTAPLVVVCYHGNTSQGAADYLAGQGFTDVYSLDGGYTAWEADST